VIGKELAKSQIVLIRFRFELIGRGLVQRNFKFLLEHLFTLLHPGFIGPVF
jgi:hypothetical protein